jgi:hypothetical protein
MFDLALSQVITQPCAFQYPGCLRTFAFIDPIYHLPMHRSSMFDLALSQVTKRYYNVTNSSGELNASSSTHSGMHAGGQ